MEYRALITGISGFAGGYLAEHLLDCGDEVLGCSLDGSWEKNSSQAVADRVELLPWDLSESGRMPETTWSRIERFSPQVIYHLAALSVPKKSGNQEPTETAVAINVDGTRRVLELADRLATNPRLLFISSCHVYAPVNRRHPKVAEDGLLGPMGGYGKTKLAAEAEIRHAVEYHACDAVIARAFQHTGPRQNPPMLLPQWAEQFAAGADPVEVYSLNAHLDLSDVRDVVRAYRMLVEEGRRGDIYNVGSGKNTCTKSILELLREFDGTQRGVSELHPRRTQEPVANIDRLTLCTGWKPEIPLRETVADTLDWWKCLGQQTDSLSETRIEELDS